MPELDETVNILVLVVSEASGPVLEDEADVAVGHAFRFRLQFVRLRSEHFGRRDATQLGILFQLLFLPVQLDQVLAVVQDCFTHVTTEGRAREMLKESGDLWLVMDDITKGFARPAVVSAVGMGDPC